MEEKINCKKEEKEKSHELLNMPSEKDSTNLALSEMYEKKLEEIQHQKQEINSKLRESEDSLKKCKLELRNLSSIGKLYEYASAQIKKKDAEIKDLKILTQKEKENENHLNLLEQAKAKVESDLEIQKNKISKKKQKIKEQKIVIEKLNKENEKISQGFKNLSEFYSKLKGDNNELLTKNSKSYLNISIETEYLYLTKLDFYSNPPLEVIFGDLGKKNEETEKLNNENQELLKIISAKEDEILKQKNQINLLNSQITEFQMSLNSIITKK